VTGPLVLNGPAVILQDANLRLVAGLAAAGLTARRRDGWTPSAAELTLLRALTDAAEMSRAGHGDVPEPPREPPSNRRTVSTAEAGRLLRISPRQVRRLTEELGGRYTASGDLEFDKDAVTLAADRRRKDKT